MYNNTIFPSFSLYIFVRSCYKVGILFSILTSIDGKISMNNNFSKRIIERKRKKEMKKELGTDKYFIFEYNRSARYSTGNN